MKSKRQEKILELIAQYAIETQEELLERLSECGIPSTQATVSRDIKQLHLYKEPCGGGRYRYASSARSTGCDFNDRLQRILTHSTISSRKSPAPAGLFRQTESEERKCSSDFFIEGIYARLMLGHSPAHGRWPRPSTRWYGKYFGRMASS